MKITRGIPAVLLAVTLLWTACPNPAATNNDDGGGVVDKKPDDSTPTPTPGGDPGTPGTPTTPGATVTIEHSEDSDAIVKQLMEALTDKSTSEIKLNFDGPYDVWMAKDVNITADKVITGKEGIHMYRIHTISSLYEGENHSLKLNANVTLKNCKLVIYENVDRPVDGAFNYLDPPLMIAKDKKLTVGKDSRVTFAKAIHDHYPRPASDNRDNEGDIVVADGGQLVDIVGTGEVWNTNVRSVQFQKGSEGYSSTMANPTVGPYSISDSTIPIQIEEGGTFTLYPLGYGINGKVHMKKNNQLGAGMTLTVSSGGELIVEGNTSLFLHENIKEVKLDGPITLKTPYTGITDFGSILCLGDTGVVNKFTGSSYVEVKAGTGIITEGTPVLSAGFICNVSAGATAAIYLPSDFLGAGNSGVVRLGNNGITIMGGGPGVSPGPTEAAVLGRSYSLEKGTIVVAAGGYFRIDGKVLTVQGDGELKNSGTITVVKNGSDIGKIIRSVTNFKAGTITNTKPGEIKVTAGALEDTTTSWVWNDPAKSALLPSTYGDGFIYVSGGDSYVKVGTQVTVNEAGGNNSILKLGTGGKLAINNEGYVLSGTRNAEITTGLWLDRIFTIGPNTSGSSGNNSVLKVVKGTFTVGEKLKGVPYEGTAPDAPSTISVSTTVPLGYVQFTDSILSTEGSKQWKLADGRWVWN